MQTEKTFLVVQEFKTKIEEILSTKKFSAVNQYMDLIKREGLEFSESEINAVVNLLAELPYGEVYEFFKCLLGMVDWKGTANMELCLKKANDEITARQLSMFTTWDQIKSKQEGIEAGKIEGIAKGKIEVMQG